MKKILMTMLTMLAVLASNAFTFDQDDKTITIFYGSRASNNANNPCKGATIRKCGVIETRLLSNDVVLQTTKWYDEKQSVARQEASVKDLNEVTDDNESETTDEVAN